MIDVSNLAVKEKNQLRTLLTPKITKYIPHVPTTKQTAFLLLDCREAFYGGAAGGGKSDSLLMCGLQYVDVKGYSGIIFRKTYADLVKPGALIDRAKEWLTPHKEVKWNEKEKKFEFYTDASRKELVSILQFGYLENINDKYNYQGGEYQFIGFDELTHIDAASYEYMFSRLRRLKSVDIPLRVRSASNPPDNDNGLWVKKRFIDEGREKGRIFISAKLDDNPYLDKEEYEKSLEELDPVTRARLRDGDWEVVRKGNMFKREWFQAVTELPQYRKRCRWWDMAATDVNAAARKNKSSDPDYTVGFLLSEYKGVYYIEDIIRERLSPEGTQKLQEDTARIDGRATIIREEQEPGSSGITLCEIKKNTIFKGYSYEAIKSTGNKTSRAAAASAAAERGQIKFLAGCRHIEDFFNEMESFPDSIHDDMVDGLSGAFTSLCSYNSPGIILNSYGSNYNNNYVDAYDLTGQNTGANYFNSYGNYGINTAEPDVYSYWTNLGSDRDNGRGYFNVVGL